MILLKCIGTIIFASLAFSATAMTKSNSDQNMKTAIDRVIQTAIKNQNIVGTVVLVYQNGHPIYKKSAGFADRETHKAMSEDTNFRLASLTKPLVAAATLKLAQEGKIKLSDNVTKYLPYFNPKLPDGSTPSITLKDLLTHTAGLNYGFLEAKDGPYHKLNISDGLDKSSITLEENVRRIAMAPLLFKPGSQFQYSLSLDVLGLVLEKATRKSLQQIVFEEVTAPLGLSKTGFLQTDHNAIATAYGDDNPPLKMTENFKIKYGLSEIVYSPSRIFDENAFVSGGAGAVSNGPEYIKFLEALRTGTLIKDLSQTLGNQIGNVEAAIVGPGWAWSSIGAYLKDPAAAHVPFSPGTVRWGGVYGHSWWIDPKRKLTVVILTNTALEGMSGKFPDDIRDAVYRNLK